MTTEEGKHMESRASVGDSVTEREGNTPPEVKVEELVGDKPVTTTLVHIATRITMRNSITVDLGSGRPDRARYAFVTAEAAVELGGSKKDVNAVIFDRVRKDLDYALRVAVDDARAAAAKN